MGVMVGDTPVPLQPPDTWWFACLVNPDVVFVIVFKAQWGLDPDRY